MHPDPQTILADLTHEALIRVSGPDAVAFLQGQLSTDVEQLTTVASQLSSWSNAKGRVVTVLRLFRRDESIYLSLPGSLLAPVEKRLSMYVLRSKVTLENADTALASFGLAGAKATDLLRHAAITPPTTPNGLVDKDGVQIIRLHGETPRYVMHGSKDAVSALAKRLEASGAKTANQDAWALAKIIAGEPTVYPETTEHFVAQMLDLEKLGGIDFKKGCYIGQEIIARAHYRGAVKRHMHRAESAAAVELRPGMEVHAKDSESPVAEIVDARRDGKDIWQMLLVVQDDAREAELVHAFSGMAVTLI